MSKVPREYEKKMLIQDEPNHYVYENKRNMDTMPKKVGHFCISFGHFRQSEADFAENYGFEERKGSQGSVVLGL